MKGFNVKYNKYISPVPASWLGFDYDHINHAYGVGECHGLAKLLALCCPKQHQNSPNSTLDHIVQVTIICTDNEEHQF